jgi:hypothetical protein
LDDTIASNLGWDDAGGAVTGYAEWVGEWNNQQVTVGWDWCVSRNLVVVVNSTEIRTNILPVDDNGEESSRFLGKAQILELIESLPWREVLKKEVGINDSS